MRREKQWIEVAGPGPIGFAGCHKEDIKDLRGIVTEMMTSQPRSDAFHAFRHPSRPMPPGEEVASQAAPRRNHVEVLRFHSGLGTDRESESADRVETIDAGNKKPNPRANFHAPFNHATRTFSLISLEMYAAAPIPAKQNEDKLLFL
jgi:hypothetical protein